MDNKDNLEKISGWYEPDLGPSVPLPESLIKTLENMKQACIQADEYSKKLDEQTYRACEGLYLE